MKKLLNKLSLSKWYWAFLLVSGLSFEVVALYHQYALDEWPCVLCIHIRIWVVGIILISILALLVRPGLLLTRILHIFTVLLAIGLTERSWQVLAVERGWIFSDCSMESGLPEWFALDRWFPVLFEVKTSCGYTPYILMQISMAEVLMVASICLMLLSLLLATGSWLKK
ncbi:MAG: disulfide bond formation protein B [Gammaproteobacteria bacterium]|nr:disulfide bond formation protein B [Gammaproteobacteria bacterium]